MQQPVKNTQDILVLILITLLFKKILQLIPDYSALRYTSYPFKPEKNKYSFGIWALTRKLKKI